MRDTGVEKEKNQSKPYIFASSLQVGIISVIYTTS